MQPRTPLDVLIVYNGNLVASATSAASVPFPATNASCNLAYAYFLATCARLGLSAGFSSSTGIIGAGTCRSYWSYSARAWHKHRTPAFAKQIFDKFSPKNEADLARRQLLFSQSSIKSFNSYSLFKLFFDKQKTYTALAPYSLPTLSLASDNLATIKKSCTSLRKLIIATGRPQDFASSIILKDRFGAGGRHIYKFKRTDYVGIQAAITTHPDLTFILQPLLKFNRGFRYQGVFVSTDIRLIYLKGRIVSAYLRVAQAGDFRCNQHQGGSLIYLHPTQVPLAVMRQAQEIATLLNKQSSLYTLDFLLANSGHAYLLEGNTGPGLNWDPTDPIDQKESKKLIRQIVSELFLRVHPHPTTLIPKRLPSFPSSAFLVDSLPSA